MPQTREFCPSPDPVQISARRIARIAFGAVLLIGVVALVIALAHQTDLRWYRPAREPSSPSAAQVIGYTWLAAAFAAAVAHAIAAVLRLRLGRDALFLPSLIAPVAGAALLLPLTLHLLVALAIGTAREFDWWASISLVLAGPAHIAFLVLSVQRVRALAAGRRARTPGRIFAITVAVACFPIVLVVPPGLVIPAGLVAITGLPIVPLLYRMARVVARERAEIAALSGPLPRAVAVVPRRVA